MGEPAATGAKPPRAVVLLSGGMDSATTLALAREQGFDTYALSLDYGQRNAAELQAARRVAAQLGCVAHQVLRLDLARFGGSALTDPALMVPQHRAPDDATIPITYVPARNTVLLAVALSWAEALGAEAIFYGANAVDYSGYPDCRPAFVAAFNQLAAIATQAGLDGHAPRIHAPLLHLSKAQIVREGLRLGVDFAQTVSCYQADDEGRACGRCDACRLRAQGFAAAGVPDPTPYAR